MKLKKYFIIFLLMITLVTLFTGTTKIEASTFSMYNPSAVSFYGTYQWNWAYCDGANANVEIKASSEDGVSRKLYVYVYVAETDTTYSYITYTDGINRIASNIPTGGGSDIRVSVQCSNSSVEITATLKLYS